MQLNTGIIALIILILEFIRLFLLLKKNPFKHLFINFFPLIKISNLFALFGLLIKDKIFLIDKINKDILIINLAGKDK